MQRYGPVEDKLTAYKQFICLQDFADNLKRVAQDDVITATSIICDVAASPQGISTTKCKINVFFKVT